MANTTSPSIELKNGNKVFFEDTVARAQIKTNANAIAANRELIANLQNTQTDFFYVTLLPENWTVMLGTGYYEQTVTIDKVTTAMKLSKPVFLPVGTKANDDLSKVEVEYISYWTIPEDNKIRFVCYDHVPTAALYLYLQRIVTF